MLTLVSFVGGRQVNDPNIEIVMHMDDPVTSQSCTTRFALHDLPLALRTYQTLRACGNLTLAEVGDWQIIEV